MSILRRAVPGDRGLARGVRERTSAAPDRLAWPWGLTLGLASGISLAGASLLLWAALPQPLAWPWLTAVPMAPWLLSGVLWLHVRRARGRKSAMRRRASIDAH
jgi:hypothetical protein